jgi:hypothetical protein
LPTSDVGSPAMAIGCSTTWTQCGSNRQVYINAPVAVAPSPPIERRRNFLRFNRVESDIFSSMRPIVRRDCDATYPDSFVPPFAEKHDPHWPSISRLAVIAATLACVGCWEEIHYVPNADTADATSPANPSPPAEAPEPVIADQATTGTDSTATEPTEPVSPEAPPTSNELFAPQLPPGQDETAPATDDGEAPAASSESILPTPPESPGTSGPENGESPASTEPAAPTPPTPAERRLAWQAASKWSLAAAIYAKGRAQWPHGPVLDEASRAARVLEIELPPLPAPGPPKEVEADVIEGLHGELAVALTNALASRFGEAEAAMADLAIRSHLLLLTYLPEGPDASLQAEALRRAGEASGLPQEIWTPLVSLVEQRAPFLEVRQAVFDLHRGADAHLAAATN